MQLNYTPLMSGVAGAIVIGIILLVYYLFQYRPELKAKDLASIHDFNELEFIEDMNPATFKHRDDRWTKGFLLSEPPFWALLIVSVRFLGGIAVPIALICGTILMLVTFLGFNYYEKLNEMDAAGVGPTTNTLCYFKKHGMKYLKIRGMKLVGNASVDKDERKTLLKKAIDVIIHMPNFKELDLKKKEEKIAFIRLVAKTIDDRLSKSLVYRFKAEKYAITIVTPNKYNDMVQPEKEKTLYKSFHVDTQLMPMWTIFCDTTKKLFEVEGSKGLSTWTSKQAGILLDAFDYSDFWKMITEGQFISRDMTTALIGQFVHLEEQNSVTKTSLNKARTDKMSAIQELESNDIEDMFNALKKLQKEMMKLIASATDVVDYRPHERNYFEYLMIAIVFLFLGVLIMALRWGL